MSDLYYLLNVSSNIINKGLKMFKQVEPWMIQESSVSIAVIVPRLEDPKTFRVPRVMIETGKFECSCEWWLMYEAPCSHLISLLETLKNTKGEDYLNALIFKMVGYIESTATSNE